MKKWTLSVLLALGAIQVVPYGRNHTNPPVRQEPEWPNATTRDLARRACFNCHSNETTWPWYASVAPVSWLAQRDVDEGRAAVNFSEWDRPQEEAKELAEAFATGDMPPKAYTVAHPEARLSGSERAALIQGLEAILAQRSPHQARER